MNEIMLFIPALMIGMLLGGIFFLGLWWTIKKGLTSQHPALWFISSLLIRTTVTVSGFYLVSAGSWQKLIACFSGFLISRLLISHFYRPPLTSSFANQQESHHAP